MQVKSRYNIAKDLMNTIAIYKSHLKSNSSDQSKKYSELEDIIASFKIIEKNMNYFEKSDSIYETTTKIIDINKIEPEKAYPLLLKKLNFDYISLPNL